MAKIVSFRIAPEELAKALDGLLTKGIDLADLTTISSIVRTTFYYGIISLCENPSDNASQEAIQRINQLSNQNKRTKAIDIKKILKTQ